MSITPESFYLMLLCSEFMRGELYQSLNLPLQTGSAYRIINTFAISLSLKTTQTTVHKRASKSQKCSFRRSAYQWSFLPLTHRSHHGGEVGLPLLLVLVLGVPDQICVDGLTVIVALQSVQLDNEKRDSRSL